jgi:hypothetical protein
VRAVEIVTKQDDEHGSDEAYERFIERIAMSGSRLAIVVKLADLADNMDLSRLGREPTEKDLARNRKYERSRDRLKNALREPEGSRRSRRRCTATRAKGRPHLAAEVPSSPPPAARPSVGCAVLASSRSPPARVSLARPFRTAGRAGRDA